ncbi:neural cell adhesion molecule 2-like [Arapaima gigas]
MTEFITAVYSHPVEHGMDKSDDMNIPNAPTTATPVQDIQVEIPPETPDVGNTRQYDLALAGTAVILIVLIIVVIVRKKKDVILQQLSSFRSVCCERVRGTEEKQKLPHQEGGRSNRSEPHSADDMNIPNAPTTATPVQGTKALGGQTMLTSARVLLLVVLSCQAGLLAGVELKCSASIDLNRSAELKCVTPEPCGEEVFIDHLVWKKDSVILAEQHQNGTESHETNRFRLQQVQLRGNFWAFSLQINNIFRTDEGIYHCSIFADCGAWNGQVRLDIADDMNIPNAPTTATPVQDIQVEIPPETPDDGNTRQYDLALAGTAVRLQSCKNSQFKDSADKEPALKPQGNSYYCHIL